MKTIIDNGLVVSERVRIEEGASPGVRGGIPLALASLDTIVVAGSLNAAASRATTAASAFTTTIPDSNGAGPGGTQGRASLRAPR